MGKLARLRAGAVAATRSHAGVDPVVRRTQRALLAIAVVDLTLLTRLPGLGTSRTFNTDEATLAVGGRTLVDGGALYVDLMDRKPPLPFAAYGFVQWLTGSEDLRWVRLLVAVLIAATALVVAHEADRRWGGRAAWVAGLGVVVACSALGPADAQAANFELFALLPIAVAFVAAARGQAVLAGAALAVAVLCKQPAAITVLPVGWSLWRHGRFRAVLVGGVSGAVVALALAAPFGVGLVVDWALLGTGGYLGLDAAGLGVAALRLTAVAGLCLAFWGGAWCLIVAPHRTGPAAARLPAAGGSGSAGVAAPGLVGTGPAIARLPGADGSGSGDVRPTLATGPVGARFPGSDGSSSAGGVGRGDGDLWLLLAVSCVGVVAGFRFFPHYLLQLVPAVALLAGRGAVRRPGRLRVASAWTVAAALVACVLAWIQATGPIPSFERDVSTYIASHTDVGDKVLVWGNLPEIYLRSGRSPAGGFTHSEFVTGYSGGRRAEVATEATTPDPELYGEWVERLRSDPPALIVDSAAAGERGGRWFALEGFPALTDLLAERYRLVATVDDAPVYRLVAEEPEGIEP